MSSVGQKFNLLTFNNLRIKLLFLGSFDLNLYKINNTWAMNLRRW
jgi:hypothetical protein